MGATVASELSTRGAFHVGYDNYVEDALTLVADQAADGFPDDNLGTWAWYEKWKGTSSANQNITMTFSTAVSINALGLAGHNLGTISATVLLQYSTNSGSSWTTLITFAPGDDDTEFRISEGASATHWRVRLTGMSAAPEIGCMFVGPSVHMKDLAEGSIPASFWDEDEGLNTRSNTGAYLGRSVWVRGGRSRIILQNLRKGWYDQYWKPFKAAYRDHPFFMAWDAARYPDEGYFCFTDEKLRPDSYRKNDYVNVELEVVAL